MYDAVERLAEDGLSRVIAFGKLSPLSYASLYFPWFEFISIILFSSTVKVNGWSGNVLRVSINNFDGIAKEPLTLLSTSIDEIIVVSKSLDVIVNFELSKSNKKWSKTGMVLFTLITPLRICSFFNNALLDTINFIEKIIKIKLHKYITIR